MIINWTNNLTFIKKHWISNTLKIWKSFIGYKTLPCKIMVSHRKVTQIWFNNYTNIKSGSNLFTPEHRTLKCTFISSTFLFAIGHLVEPTNH
jgi:hypothetical protein